MSKQNLLTIEDRGEQEVCQPPHRNLRRPMEEDKLALKVSEIS